MKVWVVFDGEYEARCDLGVYSSLEKAMAVFPNAAWEEVPLGPEGERRWYDEAHRAEIVQWELDGKT
jgi:hypothetical protein